MRCLRWYDFDLTLPQRALHRKPSRLASRLSSSPGYCQRCTGTRTIQGESVKVPETENVVVL